MQFQRIVYRIDRFAGDYTLQFVDIQIANRSAHDSERFAVAISQMVRYARRARMHFGAAEILCRNDFARCRLYQGRTAKKYGALPSDNDAFVRHCRHISAARGARSHHGGDLRNSRSRHHRLVEKNTAEMVTVRKHLVLIGEIRTTGINQVDTGQMVGVCDLLRAKMFLYCQWEIGTSFNRGVVRDDQTFAPLDTADTGDDTSGRYVVFIYRMRRQRRQFEKRRTRIEQRINAITDKHLATPLMPFAGFGAASKARLSSHPAQIGNDLGHFGFIRLIFGRCWIDGCVQQRHSLLP